MQRRGFFARLYDLWRGFWGSRLNRAEVRNAEAVYHSAIAGRVRQHDQLKSCLSRLVYLRNRLEAELRRREEDLRLVEEVLRRAALEDRDTEALKLMAKRKEVQAEVERLQAEFQRLDEQVQQGKQSLGQLADTVGVLKRERAQMLARKAHAEARLHLREAVAQAWSVQGIASADSALTNVREAIQRLEHEAELSESPDSSDTGEVSLAALRLQAAQEADRQALLALKAEVKGRMLPEGRRAKCPADLAHDRSRREAATQEVLQ